MDTVDIKFPNGSNEQFEKGKPVVILGSNGAGKTRFSIKIEALNDASYSGSYKEDSFLVQRISAQKSLTINESLSIKGISAAERSAFVGSDSPGVSKFGHKYGSHPATSLLTDYNQILSLLFAQNNKFNECYHVANLAAKKAGKSLLPPEESPVKRAERIWNNLLENREIDLSGNEVHAVFNGKPYHGKEMSDGERVVLYMIAQVLTVKKDSLIIIDEPELHIHKAILSSLWNELEKERQDCVFMYITHDLDFAASRNVDKVLWIKSFDGNNLWDYEFLNVMDFSELPTQLLYEILGTKKNLIFVEGTKDSLDYLVYSELYKTNGYNIIPCGGCSQVINYVKSKNGYDKFKHLNALGIVDKDYRMQNEIEALEASNIFVLEVAEVENLFVVPEMLEVVKDHLCKEDIVVDQAKHEIINKFNESKISQVQAAFSSEINHKLDTCNVPGKVTADEVKEKILDEFSDANINKIFDEKMELFNSKTEYEDIIKIFNFKRLPEIISNTYSLRPNGYRQLIIDGLKCSKNEGFKNEIVGAIKPYLKIFTSLK